MQIEILPNRWTNPAAEMQFGLLMVEVHKIMTENVTLGPPEFLASQRQRRLERADPLLQAAADLYSRYTVPVCRMTG